MSPTPLAIQARDVVKVFRGRAGVFSLRATETRALDGVGLRVPVGGIVALVGESGSGKSTLGRIALGLLRPSAGQVHLLGQDLAALDRAGWRALRRRAQVVFQDPFASLNPYLRVGDAIREAPQVHGLWTRAEGRARAADWLERVGLERADAGKRPHQFSGGQRQRVVIARALALEPEVVVLDEPVSALDRSVAAQVLNLLLDLRVEMGLTYLLISHDLPLVRDISEQVAILFAGKVVEAGPTREVLADPWHPYTRELLDAAGDRQAADAAAGETVRPQAPGSWAEGCRYRERCPLARPACAGQEPPVAGEAPRWVRCVVAAEGMGP